MTQPSSLSRRSLLMLGGAGSALALAACTPSPENETDAANGDSAASAVPEQIATLGDIPVGGGIAVMVAGAPVVLSQPTAGTVVGFSAICTHQGCVVAPAGEKYNCPCHGAVFDAATGDVLDGPAPRPLDSVTVTVDGEAVFVG